MHYIRNLDGVKCLVIIFRVILLWNSEEMWKLANPSKQCILFNKLSCSGLLIYLLLGG
jgi:hypothetical protein